MMVRVVQVEGKNGTYRMGSIYLLFLHSWMSLLFCFHSFHFGKEEKRTKVK